MEEELINAVRREKCLYDVKHPDYVKIKLKDLIWKRIAKGLNLKDGNEAKKAWEKLRNNHRDALRRQKNVKPKSTPEGISIKSIKPWRFQENMAFLIPHMGSRFNNSFIREEVQYDEPSQAYSDTRDSEDEEYVMNDEEPPTDNEETNQSSEPLSSYLLSTVQVHKKRRHKKNNLNKPIKEHKQSIHNRQRDKKRALSNTTNDFTVNNVKNDPLFHFFMSMYETTKTLSPLSQHTIKTNIFSLVSQEESKNLQYSPRAHSSNTQISDAGPYYASFTPSPVQVQPHDSFPAETQSAQILSTQENQELNLKEEESDSMFEYCTETFI